MPWAAAAAVGANVVGNLIGGAAAGSKEDQANAARQAALQQFLNINLPSVAEQEINLQKEQVAGNLNPALESTINQGSSDMNNVTTDPRLMNAAMTNLQNQLDLSRRGFNAQDLAALAQARNQAAGEAHSASDSALADAQRRGVGGSGMELAAKLMAAQGAANREAQNALGIAGNQEARAEQASMNAGAIGAGLQGQMFGQGAQVAQANDAISRYNAQNAQGVQGRNVAQQNFAQQFNLQNQQNVMNANTGIANQQELHNKGLYQQNFQNQLSKAQGAAGQYNSMAGNDQAQADRTRGEWSNIGQAVGSGITGYAGGQMQQQNFNKLMDMMNPNNSSRSPQLNDTSGLAGPRMPSGGYYSNQ